MTSKVYVALDTTDVAHAVSLMEKVGGYVEGMKLGLEFFTANGPQAVQSLSDNWPVFLDLKFHDIPNTVAKAVKATRHLMPRILTVHAGGGVDMMKAAKDAAHPDTKVVAVTVLTSFEQKTYLEATGVPYDGYGTDVANPLAMFAQNMAFNAMMAGLDGVVCSGHELARIKDSVLWPDCFTVVPGIRPRGGDLGDQKRVMTPREAQDAGADVLVIGRPITEADDPAKHANMIQWALASA